MKYIVTLNGMRYEVEVEQGEAVVLSETPAPAAVPVTAPAPVAAPPVAAPAPAAAPSAPAVPVAVGEKIAAPIPGSIVKINCKLGDTVKKGAVLFILEAMKMENEIYCPRNCTINQITVEQGSSVNTGDTLAIIG